MSQTADEILKKLCADLKPELEAMLLKADLTEDCCWCDNEVPFEVVGMIKEVMYNSTGKIVESAKWRLTKSVQCDEAQGVLRDYTGWAKIRMAIYGEGKGHLKTSSFDGKANPSASQYRLILICPSCLDTSGLLTAKHFASKDESSMPVKVEADEPEGVSSLKGAPSCHEIHYAGVVCGGCGQVGGTSALPTGILGGAELICGLHAMKFKGSCDTCKKFCDGHGIRPCCKNEHNASGCGHYLFDGTYIK